MYKNEKNTYNEFVKNERKKLDRPGIEPGTSRLRVRYPPWDGAKIRFDFFQVMW